MPRKKEEERCPIELGIKNYKILTNDDEVCIPSLSRILLAVQIKLAHR